MKLNLKPIIALLAIFCLSQFARAQNVSIDPLTGKPTMGIPIWTVNSGDLAASISLSYYGTPKVNDGEGSAGMGWNVNAGGAVTRELRGLPDDYAGAVSGVSGDTRNGWLHGSAGTVCSFNPSGDQNLSDCTDETADWTVLNGLGFTADTEPDVFHYSAPGLSGKFIFNRYGTRVTLPYDDVKIVPYKGSDSLINKIVITNNRGVAYTFTAGDKVTRSVTRKTSTTPSYFTRDYNYYNFVYPSASFATFYASWYLTSIASPAGGHLTFTYSTSMNVQSNKQVQVINSSGGVDTLYSINDKISTSQLLSATGSNEQANFTWTGDLLSTIAVKELTYQTVVKSFKLNYHLVRSSYLNKKRPTRAYLTQFPYSARVPQRGYGAASPTRARVNVIR